MQTEYGIINIIINNKDIYNKYYKYIDIKYIKETNINLYKIYNIINIYYNKYNNKNNISKEDLELCYISNYPIIKDSEREVLSSLLDKIYSQVPDETTGLLIEDYLSKQKVRSLAHQMVQLSLDVYEGRKEPEAIALLSSQLALVGSSNQTVDDNFGLDFAETDLEKIYEDNVLNPGLRWRLGSLNTSLGSLRKGDFGFVFARPETGKTTFLASESTCFAGQTEAPVLWFNNEEQSSKVMVRCYQAALGLTLPELYSDVKGHTRRFKELTKDNINIIGGLNGFDRKQVEKMCNKLNPSLIIFDQIDKIRGFQEDRYDLIMKDIYQWARELAKTYGPTIGVCQAGGSGENKKYLSMTDVDSSYTAKQGEADFILGIGKIDSEGAEFTRYLHLSKNKLQGDTDTDPSLRHHKWPCRIIPDKARYEDLEE